jgi:saccharopine dehydrogenase-like NADP-dependent oxidoreductase
VLGVGRVGSAIVADLMSDGTFEVTAADQSVAALQHVSGLGAVLAKRVDLREPDAVAAVARDSDLVIGALPAHLGYRALETVIDAGTNIVDISFFEEDPIQLDALARRRGVVAVVDAGVSPGLSNLILGHMLAAAGHVERFVCYVGGLPADRSGLFQYKAPFSPMDVLELYTRPARHRAGGVLQTAPALSDLQEITVPEVGTLEAFLTDGLRTALRLDGVTEMREMTLRYPGHAAQMRLLRETGLLDATPVEVNGVMVSPRALTARLLLPLWEFAPEEPDLTVLRVDVDVEAGGVRTRHRFDLLDRYDARTQTSSMARTTGYTCTAIARLIATGRYDQPGMSPPEEIGRRADCYERTIEDLASRGVVLRRSAGPVSMA